jgi:hypothetical protein
MIITARLAGTAAIVAMAATSLSPVQAKPDPTPEVTVFSGETQVAVFTTARCRKSKGDFKALTPVVNGYRLFVSIDAFEGFGNYDLEQGPNADPYASITKNGDTAFSTLYVPPFPAPGFGQVRFRGKGKDHGHRLPVHVQPRRHRRSRVRRRAAVPVQEEGEVTPRAAAVAARPTTR